MSKQKKLEMPVAAATTCCASSCHQCRYCGPIRLGGMILCNHPSWTDWDEEMRVFSPDFAAECNSFEPLTKLQAVITTHPFGPTVDPITPHPAFILHNVKHTHGANNH